jgi:hypothetical protein
MSTILSTEQARQGHTGDGVRYVLGISLALVIIFMGAALVFVR